MKKVFLILFFCLIAGESIGSSPGDFETLVKYDIKGMSADNTIVLDFNGFTYGTIDYGIYKRRGYYFVIINDNAIAEGITMFEVIKFDRFNENGDKGMRCVLKQMGESEGTFQATFVERSENNQGIGFFIIEMNGEEHTAFVYFITSKIILLIFEKAMKFKLLLLLVSINFICSSYAVVPKPFQPVTRSRVAPIDLEVVAKAYGRLQAIHDQRLEYLNDLVDYVLYLLGENTSEIFKLKMQKVYSQLKTFYDYPSLADESVFRELKKIELYVKEEVNLYNQYH